METNTNNPAFQVPKKSSKKKWFFLGLGLVSTGILSFFGYQYWKKHKKTAAAPDQKAPDFNVPKPKAQTKTKAAPKPAAPAITKPPATKAKTPIKAAALAMGFNAAIVSKTFNNVLKMLTPIKTAADYKAVNEAFQKYKIKGATQPLANALYTTFSAPAQKEALKKIFSKIGLKFNGKAWTLAGIENRPLIITTQATQVWKDPKTSVQVPLNMVLGTPIETRGSHMVFESDKQLFLVPSSHVKPYNAN